MNELLSQRFLLFLLCNISRTFKEQLNFKWCKYEIKLVTKGINKEILNKKA